MRIAILLAAAMLPSIATAQSAAPSAAERMNTPGPEARSLAARDGRWSVVATFWPGPGAQPIVTRGLIADRKMVGLTLEEDMFPTDGKTPMFHRQDFLSFSQVEGRWQYLSIDTRLPVGLMPARSYDRGTPGKMSFQFDPLAFVGFGTEVEGRMLRSDMAITWPDADHEIKEQRFILADGKGTPWVATRYEYTRLR